MTVSADFGWNEQLAADRALGDLIDALDVLFLNELEAQLYAAAPTLEAALPRWRTRPASLAPDFGPAAQDAMAIELIRRRGALEDVDAGRFDVAVFKCRREWASLPGAGYAQPERSLDALRTAYLQAGGQLA